MKARDDYSSVPAPVPPLPREGVRSRDWDITNDVLIIAYLATTYALFLYWRRFEPGVSLQAAFFLLYSLATLGAFHLTRAMKAIPELLAVPIAVLGMLLYPFLTRWAGPWATSGLACLAVWGGVTAFPSLRQRASGWMLAAAGLGILVAFVQFYAVNIRNYAFIFGDVALESGTLFQDTLFHSAIVNMLREHGTVSTGLHGLTPLAYHVGVHRWMAAVSEIIDGNAALTLAMGMQLFVIPMILHGFIRVAGAPSDKALHFVSTIAVLTVFLVAQRLFFSAYLVSESYGLSLVVLTAAVPIGMAWIARNASFSRGVVSQAMVAGALVAAAGMIKASTGLALMAFFIACMFVLTYRYRPVLALATAIGIGAVCVALLLLVYFFYFDPSLMPFDPMHFSKNYASAWYQSLLVAALCIGLLTWLNSSSLPSLPYAFVAGATFIVAAVPAQLFALASRAGFYFIHPALFIAILLTLFVANRALSDVDASRLPRWAFPGVAAGFVLLFGVGILAPALRTFEKRIAKLQVATAAPDVDGTPSLRQIAIRLTEMTESAGRRALVYVPPDNTVVWTEGGRCWAKSFIIPALTRMPMLAGVRGDGVGCESIPYYGMNAYGLAAQNRPLTPEMICQEASALGFHTVYRLDNGAGIDRIDCTEMQTGSGDAAR